MGGVEKDSFTSLRLHLGGTDRNSGHGVGIESNFVRNGLIMLYLIWHCVRVTNRGFSSENRMTIYHSGP